MALKDILSNPKYADDMVLNLPDVPTVTCWRNPLPPGCRASGPDRADRTAPEHARPG